MTTDLSLDAVDLSTAVPEAVVVQVTRPLVGKRRDVFADVPGKAGSWHYPEEPGDRMISAKIHLLADSFAERRDAVNRLAAWCDLGRRAQLIVDDEPDRYHDAILDNEPDPNEWLTAADDITLRFRATPYALAVTPSTETLAISGAGTDSGSFVIDDEVYGEPVIEVTPTDGTLTGFTITIGSDSLSYGGPTVLSGDTVTISSISDTVTAGLSTDTMLTGAYIAASLTMGQITGTFPLLTPGTNAWEFSWTGTATAVTVEISWRRRFR